MEWANFEKTSDPFSNTMVFYAIVPAFSNSSSENDEKNLGFT